GRGLGSEEEFGQMENQSRLWKIPFGLYRPAGPRQSDLVPQHQDKKTITSKPFPYGQARISEKNRRRHPGPFVGAFPPSGGRPPGPAPDRPYRGGQYGHGGPQGDCLPPGRGGRGPL